MEMEDYEKIHIRRGGDLMHCSIEMLPEGKDIPYIVIEKITFEKKRKVGERVKDEVFLAHFAPNPYTKLPWCLNLTNKRKLCKLAGVGEYDLLSIKNLAIRLTKAKTSVGDGLRVSDIPAEVQSKPVLSPAHEKWGACIGWVRNGGTVAELAEKYEFSKENQELFNLELQK